MHELPVIRQILELAVRQAIRAKAYKILTIFIEVGELSDLQDEWIQKYFGYVSRGTLAEAATLIIERIPVMMYCEECKNTFNADLKKNEQINCPRCGGRKYEIRSGRGYLVKNIEVI